MSRTAEGSKVNSPKSEFLLCRLGQTGFPKMLVAKKPGVWAEIVQADMGLRVLPLSLPLSLSSLPSLFWVAMCQPTNLSGSQFLPLSNENLSWLPPGGGQDKMESGAKAPGIP